MSLFDDALKKLGEAISEKAIYWIISTLGLGANGALHGNLVNDPFYHGGWIATHKAWGFFFIALSIAGIMLCRSATGFWITLSTALLCAVGFGVIYDRFEGQWIFVGWFLHGVFLSLLAGVVAFTITQILQKKKPRARSR
jgi:hypothetical protein